VFIFRSDPIVQKYNSRPMKDISEAEVFINDLIRELIDDFFLRDKERIKIKQPDTTIKASVDGPRMSLLLKNLLSNALRYSKPSDGPIELTAGTADNDLIFTVRDHGPGLSEDQAEHIGEPFYRGDPSRTRDSGGTGLGLYLASLIAKAHGGSLRLLDTDRGACFEVAIPLA